MSYAEKMDMARAARARAEALAKEYRDFWGEHQALAFGIGFVPVVGSLMGIADAAAAGLDERADALEKGLATAGIIPYGKALSAVGKLAGLKGLGGVSPVLSMVGGPTFIKDMENAGRAQELINRRFSPRMGMEIAETVDDPVLKRTPIASANATNQPVVGKFSEMVDDHTIKGLPLENEITMRYDPAVHTQAGQMLPSGYGPRDKAEVTLGTFGDSQLAKGGGVSQADMSDILRTFQHETTHAGMRREVGAGNALEEAVGASYKGKGNIGYFHNPGEILAETEAMRLGWTREQREALPIDEHMFAVLRRVQDDIKAGKSPIGTAMKLRTPSEAKRAFEEAKSRGLDTTLIRAANRGDARWDLAGTLDRSKGDIAMRLDTETLINLDPMAGAKITNAGIEGRVRAATPDAPGRKNWKRAMINDEAIPPPVVDVLWNPKKNQWTVNSVDGVVRALAARSMHGKNVNIPVVFRPKGSYSRQALAEQGGTIRPDLLGPSERTLAVDRKRNSAAILDALNDFSL